MTVRKIRLGRRTQVSSRGVLEWPSPLSKIERCDIISPFPAAETSLKGRFPESRGAVAQLGERRNGIAKVRGSIPLGSTTDFQRMALQHRKDLNWEPRPSGCASSGSRQHPFNLFEAVEEIRVSVQQAPHLIRDCELFVPLSLVGRGRVPSCVLLPKRQLEIMGPLTKVHATETSDLCGCAHRDCYGAKLRLPDEGANMRIGDLPGHLHEERECNYVRCEN